MGKNRVEISGQCPRKRGHDNVVDTTFAIKSATRSRTSIIYWKVSKLFVISLRR